MSFAPWKSWKDRIYKDPYMHLNSVLENDRTNKTENCMSPECIKPSIPRGFVRGNNPICMGNVAKILCS
jgi:hypothetical protein